MTTYYVSRFEIHKLWGYRDLDLRFYDDVNIIIGPNASGKTTIISLLQYVLTGNIAMLAGYDFDSIALTLRPFDGKTARKIQLDVEEDTLRFRVSRRVFRFPRSILRRRTRAELVFDWGTEHFSHRYRPDFFEVRALVEALVQAVWLPVSRRLPIAEDEEQERRSGPARNLESVDECLSELADRLQQYRLSLDSVLAELRKQFQRHALENILYDTEHDSGLDAQSYVPPTEDEEKQLMEAFSDVGFLDQQMEKRIRRHFQEAKAVGKRLKKTQIQIDWKMLSIIPLIKRTKAMIGFAQELESRRRKLFAPLRLFEETVNSFLNDKRISITDGGLLSIVSLARKKQTLGWRQLSSGEKQILILLTQALLWEDKPVIYVADEPELSLHVTWQAMLLKSLTQLAGQCQLIVATHSPDIVGPFNDRVINLGAN